jgi:hypothetical protein
MNFNDTKNFLISLAALRDSTKYALDFLNNQDFDIANNNEDNTVTNENIDCTQAFDVLKTLKRDVRTFTNTNFLTIEDDKDKDEDDDDDDEFKECKTTVNFDNFHSQLSMIVDSFNSELDFSDARTNLDESKLDIVLSHQEMFKSIEISNYPNSQYEINNIEKAATLNEKITYSNEKITNSNEKITNSNEKITNSKEKIANSNEKITNSNEKITNSNEKIANSNEVDNNNKPNPETKNEKIETTEKNNMKNNKIPEIKIANIEGDNKRRNSRFNKNDLRIIIDDSDSLNMERDKSSAAKNFLLSNTMPQTPEIEKIKNYVTDIDLNKLNNIEIIKLILDSLIQTCNELLQFKSDTLSDVLGSYPKSPLSEAVIINNFSIPGLENTNEKLLGNANANNKELPITNNLESNANNNNAYQSANNNENSSYLPSPVNSASPTSPSNPLNLSRSSSPVPTSPIINPSSPVLNPTSPALNPTSPALNPTSPALNPTSPALNPTSPVLNPTSPVLSPSSPVLSPLSKGNAENSNKQKSPKELLKELECLIILIHSLYENEPLPNSPSSPTDIVIESGKPSIDIPRKSNCNDSMSSILTSNTELNSVINAIDSLIKSSPRFNNQCVQITADSKKKFQLMGVMSVVDRMTRTRLNDQRASPKQLDHINRLIELLNKSLVRQYEEQRFTISPDKERKMELGRLQYLVEKSKNSRLTNQDWCSQKVIREKEIEDMFEQTKYKTLENQRFIVGPEKEKDMYFNSLLKRVDKLDSYRLSNQDAVIKPRPVNDSLHSFTSNESETEVKPKRKEGPIKRLRRFSKSIMS